VKAVENEQAAKHTNTNLTHIYVSVSRLSPGCELMQLITEVMVAAPKVMLPFSLLSIFKDVLDTAL
jgi:hypothetical protein